MIASSNCQLHKITTSHTLMILRQHNMEELHYHESKGSILEDPFLKRDQETTAKIPNQTAMVQMQVWTSVVLVSGFADTRNFFNFKIWIGF